MRLWKSSFAVAGGCCVLDHPCMCFCVLCARVASPIMARGGIRACRHISVRHNMSPRAFLSERTQESPSVGVPYDGGAGETRADSLSAAYFTLGSRRKSCSSITQLSCEEKRCQFECLYICQQSDEAGRAYRGWCNRCIRMFTGGLTHRRAFTHAREQVHHRAHPSHAWCAAHMRRHRHPSRVVYALCATHSSR